jgi:hypothetical protein
MFARGLLGVPDAASTNAIVLPFIEKGTENTEALEMKGSDLCLASVVLLKRIFAKPRVFAKIHRCQWFCEVRELNYILGLLDLANYRL